MYIAQTEVQSGLLRRHRAISDTARRDEDACTSRSQTATAVARAILHPATSSFAAQLFPFRGRCKCESHVTTRFLFLFFIYTNRSRLALMPDKKDGTGAPIQITQQYPCCVALERKNKAPAGQAHSAQQLDQHSACTKA